MKTRIILFLMLFVVTIPMQGVAAGPALPPGVTHSPGLWTVYPHNSSPDDPNRIQAVIDLATPGDTVRLAAGTFDFSEFETVRIAKDLTLEGAWDNHSQKPLTTIKHGFIPVIIGRKTPIVKPEMVEVNGHLVYHLTMDLWGKMAYPFLYPEGGGGNYDIFDDWTRVHVNVRQIAFERPFVNAITVGAMNGGAIERIRIHSVWPLSLDFEGGGDSSNGISFYNISGGAYNPAEWGRAYYPNLYRNTDLIRGNITVRDSFIDGDVAAFAEGTTDEAGDLVAVRYVDNPEPPGGDYDNYVLQDVAFAWDDTYYPVPSSIQLYWVKKGYTAWSESAWSDSNLVWADRGAWAGVYSFFAQSNLKVLNNVIQGCSASVFFLENGYTGVPFKALIQGNQITSSAGNYWWGAAFDNLGWEHYIPATGQTLTANPGSFVTMRNNTVKILNQDLSVEPAVYNAMVGRLTLTENRFDLASGSGFWLSPPTQASILSNNRLSGAGSYAAWVDSGVNGNLIVANDLRKFTISGPGSEDPAVPPAHVVLLSDNNRVIGGPHAWDETVLDYGANNTVIGMIHQVGVPATAASGRATPQGKASPLGRGHRGLFFGPGR